MHAVTRLGGWLTHHSLGQSAELHVVGGEDCLPVALDECRLLGDEPEPILQTRTQVTRAAAGAVVKRGQGRGHTHRIDDHRDAPGLGRF